MKQIELEKRIAKIEKRNLAVENDKQWETCWERRILLIGFTYISIGSYMWAIAVERPWLNAVIPSAGFLLSTLTLPTFKKWWLKKHQN